MWGREAGVGGTGEEGGGYTRVMEGGYTECASERVERSERDIRGRATSPNWRGGGGKGGGDKSGRQTIPKFCLLLLLQSFLVAI